VQPTGDTLQHIAEHLQHTKTRISASFVNSHQSSSLQHTRNKRNTYLGIFAQDESLSLSQMRDKPATHL